MAGTSKVLEVSPEAIEMISGLRDEESRDAPIGLLIKVSGVRGGQFTYELGFSSVTSLDSEHLIEYHEDLAMIIPEADIEKLRGAKISISSGGLAMDNPNHPESPDLASVPGDLEGPLAERVEEILATRVNPALAGHGGYAELISVDGTVVYLQMAGGCQGCGMAQVTLHQGIERVLKESIPEISEVRDVTDHASGERPYY